MKYLNCYKGDCKGDYQPVGRPEWVVNLVGGIMWGLVVFLVLYGGVR